MIRKRLLRTISAFLAATMMVSVMPTELLTKSTGNTGVVSAATANGWQSSGGNWYYYTNGTAATGWKQIGTKWYYFASNGVMQTGWKQISGKWYYFDASGAMVTGWKQLGGIWYYFDASGAMVTGWKQLGGIWYYFDASGAMVTGWKQIGKIWYYFDSTGAMATGWNKIGTSWYYHNGSGEMVTGWKQIGGDWYYFESSGAMATTTATNTPTPTATNTPTPTATNTPTPTATNTPTPTATNTPRPTATNTPRPTATNTPTPTATNTPTPTPVIGYISVLFNAADSAESEIPESIYFDFCDYENVYYYWENGYGYEYIHRYSLSDFEINEEGQYELLIAVDDIDTIYGFVVGGYQSVNPEYQNEISYSAIDQGDLGEYCFLGEAGTLDNPTWIHFLFHSLKMTTPTSGPTATPIVMQADVEYEIYESDMDSERCVRFCFTPEESGTYTFVSMGANDPELRVYIDGVNVVTEDDSIGRQFSLLSNLKAGTTYDLVVYHYESSSSFEKPTIFKVVPGEFIPTGYLTIDASFSGEVSYNDLENVYYDVYSEDTGVLIGSYDLRSDFSQISDMHFVLRNPILVSNLSDTYRVVQCNYDNEFLRVTVETNPVSTTWDNETFIYNFSYDSANPSVVSFATTYSKIYGYADLTLMFYGLYGPDVVDNININVYRGEESWGTFIGTFSVDNGIVQAEDPNTYTLSLQTDSYHGPYYIYVTGYDYTGYDCSIYVYQSGPYSMGDSFQAEYFGTSESSPETYTISFNYAVSIPDCPEMYLDTTYEINEADMDSSGNVYYTFTPSISGVYTFTSYGSNDPKIYLYENGEEIAVDDDTNGDSQFILSYELTAGTTYTITIYHFDHSSWATPTTVFVTAGGPEPTATPTPTMEPSGEVGYISIRVNLMGGVEAEDAAGIEFNAYNGPGLMDYLGTYSMGSDFQFVNGAYELITPIQVPERNRDNSVISFNHDVPGFTLFMANWDSGSKSGTCNLDGLGLIASSDGSGATIDDPVYVTFYLTYMQAGGPVVTTTPNPQDYEVIHTGYVLPIASDMMDSNNCVYYSFTPEEDGEYTFNSYGENDPMININDQYGNWIAECDDASDLNFSVCTYLYSDTTYYISVKHLSGPTYGNPTIFEVTAGNNVITPVPIPTVVPEHDAEFREISLNESVVITQDDLSESGRAYFVLDTTQLWGTYKFSIEGSAGIWMEIKDQYGDYISAYGYGYDDGIDYYVDYLYGDECYLILHKDDYVEDFSVTFTISEYNEVPVYDTLYLDTPYETNEENCSPLGRNYLQFTPEESGTYTFYSEGRNYPACEVSYNGNSYGYREDNFGRHQFAVSAYLESGITYNVVIYGGFFNGSTTVNVIRGDVADIPVPTPAEGQLVVASWNEELFGIAERCGYGDSFFVLIEGGDNYQVWLDGVLASGENAPDIFATDADFTSKYTNSEFATSMRELGITDSELSNMYDFTLDFARSGSDVYGLAWSVCPGVVFYNTNVAQQTLGVSDPSDVAPYFADWNAFLDTARTVNTVSNGTIKAIADDSELFRFALGGRSDRWVSNGNLNVDQAVLDYMDLAKILADENLTFDCGQWTSEWDRRSTDGSVLSYWGPLWLGNFSLGFNNTWGSSNPTAGQWKIVNAPSTTFWGGTWIVASKYCDTEQAAQFMRALTMDEDILMDLARGGDCPNNKNIVASLANNDEFCFGWLGGQNPYSVLHNSAMSINGGLFTNDDENINEALEGAVVRYLYDGFTKEEAVGFFIQSCEDLGY